jgi:hypothetical protein
MSTLTWQIKLAIGAAIIAVVGLLGWFAVHEYHTVLSDNQKIGSDAVVIKGQATTIVQQASTAAVTDAVVASSVKADQAAAATGSKIDAWVADQTKQIDSKYANPTTSVVAPATTATSTASSAVKPKPVVPVKTITSDQAGDVVPVGRDAEVSAVQLTGSWMKYCAAIDNADAKCTALPQAQ